MIGDRAEPLAAIYPAEARVDLVAALSGVDFSLQTATQRLVQADRLRVISVAEAEEFFRNLNEPADFKCSRRPIDKCARMLGAGVPRKK